MNLRKKMALTAKKTLIVAAPVLLSTQAFADDAAITAAFDAGNISLGLAVAGSIALSAIVLGLGLITGIIKRT